MQDYGISIAKELTVDSAVSHYTINMYYVFHCESVRSAVLVLAFLMLRVMSSLYYLCPETSTRVNESV